MDELLLVYVTGNMHIYTVCPEYLHCSTYMYEIRAAL